GLHRGRTGRVSGREEEVVRVRAGEGPGAIGAGAIFGDDRIDQGYDCAPIHVDAAHGPIGARASGPRVAWRPPGSGKVRCDGRMAEVDRGVSAAVDLDASLVPAMASVAHLAAAAPVGAALSACARGVLRDSHVGQARVGDRLLRVAAHIPAWTTEAAWRAAGDGGPAGPAVTAIAG